MEVTPNHRPRTAFTLIELLVCIAIIAVLISIILPAMARSKTAARLIRCSANLSQIGVANTQYLSDFRGSYAVHQNWASLVGPWGNRPQFYDEKLNTGWEGETTPGGVEVKIRPLNRYLDHKGVTRCPDDRGDVLQNTKNCYEAYGTSYLPSWNSENFATAHTTATNADKDHRPMKDFDPRGPQSNKLVMSEWVWHGNRSLAQPQNLWHNIKVLRQYNILFGDGHAALFTFPREIEKWFDPKAALPDPGRGWW